MHNRRNVIVRLVANRGALEVKVILLTALCAGAARERVLPAIALPLQRAAYK
jgi:hypothetical protein